MAKHVQGSAVANATSYKLYENIGGNYTEKATQPSGGAIDFDLSTISFAAGTHQLAVKAFASGYLDSAYSNLVDYIVAEEPVAPTNYTFTINPTPTSATVTLSATGYSTVSGTGSKSITVANGTTVSWKVSADGYTEQNGTWTANGQNKTLPVTLVKNEEPEEPTETTWYIDNAEQTGKTFNYSTNFPGAAARIDSVASAIRGVPINAVKLYPSVAGIMYFARWMPGNMPTFAASIEIPVEDVYTSAPANGAGAKTYMLSETITLATDELLLCKWNDPSTTADAAGFWVNAGGGGDYAVAVWSTADNTAQNESWGLPFSIGYVK